MQLEVPGIRRRAKDTRQRFVVPVAVGFEDVAVPVDLEHSAGDVADGFDERVDDRAGIHAGADALDVDADPESAPVAAHGGRRHPLEVDDVRMREDECFALPSAPDLAGGAGGEGDEGIRRRDEHVQLSVVLGAVLVMGVAQIVHRVDQRATRTPQGLDELPQLRRSAGIEAELDVEDVELAAVRLDPAGIEHRRRPPA